MRGDKRAEEEEEEKQTDKAGKEKERERMCECLGTVVAASHAKREDVLMI